MTKPYLFSPGPVMVSDRVRKSLLHYDICHRGQEFMDLFADTQVKIKKLLNAGDTYYALIISGSGTSSNECVLSSLFEEKDTALLVSNGEFGERLEGILDKYNVKKYKPSFEWGEFPDLSKIESCLKEHEDIKVISMVYHETSTGMINPVEQVGELAKKYNKIFHVDAVSAAAGEPVDVEKQHIDIVTSVAGKALGAFPGSAYICAKEEILESIKEEQCRNIYLNLSRHYKYAKSSHQTPNTPNVNLIFGLNEALSEILEMGVDKKIARYKECSSILRKGLKELGMTFLLDEKYMSNTVTSVFLPEGKKVEEFIKAMERSGYVVYEGKGKYKEMNMFQVANMGEIYPEDCYEFLKVLKENLKQ